ncbi:hypothetical protein [Flavobacterium hydatis]|uniref:Uncharacterized protein n=1 Tax=Flavobacterium hydatis TaxID=991 RepID=A0A086ANZ4_FLAHY|nr:hypothetical protein [Flavobacterium hydatis]KFF18408.1 hypothetical protein IW20_05795 [Flavobacterium hydatis]OXA96844.1 hypothetical protein B0A62_06220 [Flavobacterium hydatis]
MTILKAQEKIKDTLFLKLDGKYIYESKYDSKQYTIEDNNDIKNGAIYFKEFKIVNNIKPKKIVCFKKFAQSSKMYNENDKKKLSELKVMNLFDSHIVILVNKKNKKAEYVQIGPVYITE